MDFRDVIAQLLGLHNAGAVPVPGLPATVAAPPEPGDVPHDILSKLLRFYEQNKTLFVILLPLLQKIPGLFSHPAAAPPAPPAPAPVPPPPPAPPVAVVEPPASVARKIAALSVKYFWINRKNTPYTEGGGRSLLSTAQFQAVISRADPLQAGDRVTLDITPIDQFGRPFQPADSANVLMKGIEHWVVGGVAELQLQDPENLGYDPTPTLFVPWEPESGVKPGFQGELGYYCTYTDPGTGAEIRSNELPNLRIRPWA